MSQKFPGASIWPSVSSPARPPTPRRRTREFSGREAGRDDAGEHEHEHEHEHEQKRVVRVRARSPQTLASIMTHTLRVIEHAVCCHARAVFRQQPVCVLWRGGNRRGADRPELPSQQQPLQLQPSSRAVLSAASFGHSVLSSFAILNGSRIP